MSERYSRLFALPTDLYTTDSPIVIAAGALLKDNQTGKVLVQLKLRSISSKSIKAVKVCITSMDTAGRALGEAVEHQYLDLSISRDAEFGQKSAVLLPDPSARSFSAAVTEVVFRENTIWASNNANWQPLPRPAQLANEIKDEELVKQYQLTYGKQCQFSPLSHGDLWFCSCGAINRAEEGTCHSCHLEYTHLISVQWNELEEARDIRLAKEKAEAEQQAVDAARREAAAKAAAVRRTIEQAEQDRKKAHKKKVIGTVFAAFAVLALTCYFIVTMIVIPARQYAEAESLETAGRTAEAAIAFYNVGDYKDARERCFELWDKCAIRETLSFCDQHIVGLKTDGTLVSAGDNADGQCDVSSWRDIIAVSTGLSHTVGLRADGTVLAVGDKEFNRTDVSAWTDIVSISANWTHTAGLKADGTAVITDYIDTLGHVYNAQCDVNSWSDIVMVSAGMDHTLGLKANGTVLATGANDDGECNVGNWSDIISISAGLSYSLGLKADGTVVATGQLSGWNGLDVKCDVSNWTDVISISAGHGHAVGLKADGTVLATGGNDHGQCDVGSWTDIVAVCANGYHTVGLKADGTVLAVGNQPHERWFNISDYIGDWTDIKLPNTLKR